MSGKVILLLSASAIVAFFFVFFRPVPEAANVNSGGIRHPSRSEESIVPASQIAGVARAEEKNHDMSSRAKTLLHAAAFESQTEKRPLALTELATALKTNGHSTKPVASVPSATLMELTKISADTNPTVRAAAFNRMGDLVDNDPNTLSQLWTLLSKSEKFSSDEDFRSQALRMIVENGQRHMGLPDDVLAEIVPFLWDRREQNRSLAAQGFAGASSRAIDQAVVQLEKTFFRESDPDIRNVVLFQIVEVGRVSAIPFLQRIPTTDPLMAEAQDLLQTLERSAALAPAR